VTDMMLFFKKDWKGPWSHMWWSAICSRQLGGSYSKGSNK